MQTSYLFFFVGAVSIGLLVGCAADSGSDSKEQSLDVVASGLGFSDFSIDSFEQVSLEQQRLKEDTIAVCMLQAGFEYTPEYERPNSNKPKPAEGETAADYAETHGWGVAESRVALSADGQISPNAAYRRSLSASELAAYDVALWRDDGNEPNCSTVAAERVQRESKLSVAFDDYGDGLNDLIGQFWSDLRIRAFHNEWSTCMAEWGYDYPSPSAMQVDLQERSDAVISAGPQQFADLLDETLGYETRAATASLECGLPPSLAGEPEVYRQVLTDLAHGFLRDNPEFGQR